MKNESTTFLFENICADFYKGLNDWKMCKPILWRVARMQHLENTFWKKKEEDITRWDYIHEVYGWGSFSIICENRTRHRWWETMLDANGLGHRCRFGEHVISIMRLMVERIRSKNYSTTHHCDISLSWSWYAGNGDLRRQLVMLYEVRNFFFTNWTRELFSTFNRKHKTPIAWVREIYELVWISKRSTFLTCLPH